MDVLQAAFSRLRRAFTRGDGTAEPPPALPGFGRLLLRRKSEHVEFDDLLSSLGADGEVAGPETAVERKDAEIAELQRNLEMLRPIGDELAETEKARLTLEAKARDLETIAAEQVAARQRDAEAHARELATVRARLSDELTSAFARDESRSHIEAERDRLGGLLAAAEERAAELERILAEREAAADVSAGAGTRETALPREVERLRERLARLEKRHAALRARYDERDAKATERWHELRQLRRRLRELERGS